MNNNDISVDELIRWMYDHLDTLFPSMEWKKYAKGWRSHYHNDDFTLSSDKRNQWQTSCLEKSHYCTTDVARGTVQLIKMYAAYTNQSDKDATKELFRMMKGESPFPVSNITLPPKKEKEEKPTEIVYLTKDINETTSFLNQFALFGNSPFARYFGNFFSPDTVQTSATSFGIREQILPDGTSLTIFPYINSKGKIAMMKRIPYGADGHRLKETAQNGNVESAKTKIEHDFEKCFFGENKIGDSKNIIVAESEKTAFILNIFFSTMGINKDCAVVASGGKSWLYGRLQRQILRGKNIFLLADLSKEDGKTYDWEITSNLIEIRDKVGINSITLIDYARFATKEEKQSGADIADIILRLSAEWIEEGKRAMMTGTQESPSVKAERDEFIDALTIYNIVSKESEAEDWSVEELPHLDFNRLLKLSPQILRDITELEIVPELREFLMLASIVSFGQTFDNVVFDYGAELDQHLQLNLIISAKSGSGKGKLNTVRHLFSKVHERINAGSKLAREEWERKRREEEDNSTPPPPNKTFFIPGNTTASALINTLYENEGRGMILESELDTVTSAMKNKFGDFSSILRNAFHGETVSINRRQDNTLMEIEVPHLSFLATGTPDQIKSFFDGQIENGLFSRFCFYTINTKREWRDPFMTNTTAILLSSFQDRIEKLFLAFQTAGTIRVEISDQQKRGMNEFMRGIFDDYKNFTDEEADSSIFRMGITLFRVAITLSILEYEGKPVPPRLAISNNAFEFAKMFVECMLPFTFRMWDALKKGDKEQKEQGIRGAEILDKLPNVFKTGDVLEYFSNRMSASRTIAYWQEQNTIKKVKQGEFVKVK